MIHIRRAAAGPGRRGRTTGPRWNPAPAVAAQGRVANNLAASALTWPTSHGEHVGFRRLVDA